MSFLPHHRLIKKGGLLRFAADRYVCDEALFSKGFRARGKLRVRAKIVGDIDHGDFRADNTRGWKAHKHRAQWEHNVIEAEKHADNRRRKDARRKRAKNDPVSR